MQWETFDLQANVSSFRRGHQAMKGLQARRVSSLTDLVDHGETRKSIIKACKSEECISSSEFVISRDILQSGTTETAANVSRSQHSGKCSKVSINAIVMHDQARKRHNFELFETRVRSWTKLFLTMTCNSWATATRRYNQLIFVVANSLII